MRENLHGEGSFSVEYMQVLARISGIVFAAFAGINAGVLQPMLWQWIVMLSAVYIVENFAALYITIRNPSLEAVLNLLFCAGLTVCGAEYSSILYQCLLTRIVMGVRPNRVVRVASCVTLVYLAASIVGIELFSLRYIMSVISNLLGLGVLTCVALFIHALSHKRFHEEQKLEELRKENSCNQQLALTDELTGLYNYRAYNEKVAKLDQYALILIDIDHFKQINDEYGHTFGNSVLREMGDIICRNIRSVDLAYRYGGEEFAVILPNANHNTAAAIAERLCYQVACCQFSCSNQHVPVTISIGVSLKKSHQGATVAFEQADQALYRAKQLGRNNVQWAGFAKSG